MPLTETEDGFYAKTLQEDITKRFEGFLEEKNSTSMTVRDAEGILRSVLEEALSKGIIEDFSKGAITGQPLEVEFCPPLERSSQPSRVVSPLKVDFKIPLDKNSRRDRELLIELTFNEE